MGASVYLYSELCEGLSFLLFYDCLFLLSMTTSRAMLPNIVTTSHKWLLGNFRVVTQLIHFLSVKYTPYLKDLLQEKKKDYKVSVQVVLKMTKE